jgi:hypothetical protein
MRKDGADTENTPTCSFREQPGRTTFAAENTHFLPHCGKRRFITRKQPDYTRPGHGSFTFNPINAQEGLQ